MKPKQCCEVYRCGHEEGMKHGKKELAKELHLKFFPNKEKIPEPAWHPKNPFFLDFTKNPLDWKPTANLYNRVDGMLPLVYFLKVVQRVAGQYIDQDRHSEANTAFFSAVVIAMCGTTKVYSRLNPATPRKHSHPDPRPFSDGCAPMHAPGDLWENYRQNNPCIREDNRVTGTDTYPTPLQVLRRLFDRQNHFNFPVVPVVEGTEDDALVICQMEYLNDYPLGKWLKKDNEIARKHWRKFKNPHVCLRCKESGHVEKDCVKELKSSKLHCAYPYCQRLGHSTEMCPTILKRCSECQILGHDKSLHRTPKFPFDVVIYFLTLKAYARLHRTANLLNNQELMLIVPRDDSKKWAVKFGGAHEGRTDLKDIAVRYD